MTIRLRRSKAVQSQAVALVRSTDLGSAQEMLHYVPLDKRVVFAPGIAEMAINFYWNTDEIPAEGVTVSFELSILQGKALPGDAATAMLTIDNPVNNAGR